MTSFLLQFFAQSIGEKFWKSAKIWQSYECWSFLTHSVYKLQTA